MSSRKPFCHLKPHAAKSSMESGDMSSAKLNAAKSAVKLIPKEGTIGLGSGSTVAIFAKELGRKISENKARIAIVPSSYQAYQLALEYDIPTANLDRNPELLLTVDGADEVDKELNLTKGGGGALFQEKIVAFASKRFIVIVDESKIVNQLATKFDIPCEVTPEPPPSEALPSEAAPTAEPPGGAPPSGGPPGGAPTAAAEAAKPAGKSSLQSEMLKEMERLKMLMGGD